MREIGGLVAVLDDLDKVVNGDQDLAVHAFGLLLIGDKFRAILEAQKGRDARDPVDLLFNYRGTNRRTGEVRDVGEEE